MGIQKDNKKRLGIAVASKQDKSDYVIIMIKKSRYLEVWGNAAKLTNLGADACSFRRTDVHESFSLMRTPRARAPPTNVCQRKSLTKLKM